MEKLTKGLIKGVLSGDTVIISGKLPKNEKSDAIPEEFNLTLTGIQAPRIGNSSKLEEENYAFESREFLRKMIIGKVVSYKVDFTNNERKFGHIVYENKNINAEIVRQGLAKLNSNLKSHENVTKSEFFKEIQEAEANSKEKKLGIWSNSTENKKRNLVSIADEQSFDKKLIENAISKKLEIDGIIEYVFNSAFMTVYIPTWQAFAKINLRLIAIPSNTKDPIVFKKGKSYMERLILSKDVKLRIFEIDENKNLICDVFEKNQNIAENILKEGYSKIFSGNNKKYNSIIEINTLKNYENIAKNKRLNIWRNEQIAENKKGEELNNELSNGGKCVMANTGDSLTIMTPDKKEVRIFLSNLKAPKLSKPNTDEQNEPWAFQAREFLRKKLVGQQVDCHLDYQKLIQTNNTNNPNPNNASSKTQNRLMKFYTIHYKNNNNEEQCINIDLLKNGLANLTNFKIDEGSPSAEFDKMLQAESYAKEHKIGIFSNKIPPLGAFSDLISANKIKKKEFVNFLLGLNNIDCVIDYCFGPSKFKVRINQKQCMIPFSLLGIKTFTNDKNNSTQIQQFFKDSLEYVVDLILQHDCKCDVISSDKVGNYFGNLIFEGKNFATTLLEKGLAVINESNQIELKKCKFLSEMKKAEENAINKKIGIWNLEGLGNVLKYGENIPKNITDKKFTEQHKDIEIRITDSIDLDKFYCNFLPNKTLDEIEKVLEKYSSEKKKGTQLTLPIKNGTLCAARFPDDQKFYRGIVKGMNKKKEYEIEFIDYGNIEYCPISDLIKLDDSISNYPPQCNYCELAYMKYSKRSMKKAVNKYPDFIDFDNKLKAKLCYSYNVDDQEKYGLFIYNKNDGNALHSYHADLLKLGYAKLDRENKGNLPAYLKELDKVEKEAMEQEIGVWDENEETDYDLKEEEDNE